MDSGRSSSSSPRRRLLPPRRHDPPAPTSSSSSSLSSTPTTTTTTTTTPATSSSAGLLRRRRGPRRRVAAAATTTRGNRKDSDDDDDEEQQQEGEEEERQQQHSSSSSSGDGSRSSSDDDANNNNDDDDEENEDKRSSSSSDTDTEEALTAYEKWRPPILPQDDELNVAMPFKDLSTHFKCPVCLGILRDTHVIMECLHRFCFECISKSLRLGKKECPSCRVKCPSRRSLRADPNFDGIIRRFYPNLDEFETQELERAASINAQQNQQATSKSLLEGARAQAESKRLRYGPRGGYTKEARRHKSASEAERASEQNRFREQAEAAETASFKEFEFFFQCHPNEGSLRHLDSPYITAPINCSVQTLCQYLDKEIGDLNHRGDYQISLTKKGRTLILPKYMTLADILEHYWKPQVDLILHYSLASTALQSF